MYKLLRHRRAREKYRKRSIPSPTNDDQTLINVYELFTQITHSNLKHWQNFFIQCLARFLKRGFFLQLLVVINFLQGHY